jgi:NADH-quinone oxidoreductase subunit G
MLHALGQELARVIDGHFGVLGEAANSVGGYVAGALPTASGGGLNALAMVDDVRKAYVVLHAEPELDCHDPSRTLAALQSADSVIVMSPFKSSTALDYADCLLPIAPFTETGGTFVNMEGRIQSFNAVAKPPEFTRPAWKVFRVLGSVLGLSGFDFDTVESVRDEVLGSESGFAASHVDNQVSDVVVDFGVAVPGLQRVADVPVYFADPLVRRAPSLQATRDAQTPKATMNQAVARELGLAAGDTVTVRQTGGDARMEVAIDDGVAGGCVRIAAAHASTVALGAMFGAVTLERA